MCIDNIEKYVYLQRAFRLNENKKEYIIIEVIPKKHDKDEKAENKFSYISLFSMLSEYNHIVSNFEKDKT